MGYKVGDKFKYKYGDNWFNIEISNIEDFTVELKTLEPLWSIGVYSDAKRIDFKTGHTWTQSIDGLNNQKSILKMKQPKSHLPTWF